MEISKLTTKNKYKHPGYNLIDSLEVAVPIYRIPLDIVIQKKKKLSIIQEFCLKLIKEDLKDVNKISELLGIGKNIISDNISKLVDYDVIKYNESFGINITEKGYSVLKEMELQVPMNLNYTFNMDALTGKIYVDDRTLYNNKNVRDKGLKYINVIKDRPNLDDMKFKDVRTAMRKYNLNPNKKSEDLEGDLFSVNSMDNPYVQYKEVNLLIFCKKNDIHINNDDIIIDCFEKNTFLEEYKDLINISFVKNILLEKKETEVLKEAHKENELIHTINTEVIEEINNSKEEYEQVEKDYITNSETLKLIEKSNSLDVKDSNEFEKLSKQILSLQEQINRLSKNRVVYTYEHRDLLLEALDTAKESVIIISPWIRRSAFNKELREIIEKTIKRKVHVTIGYGISSDKDGCDEIIIHDLKNLSNHNNNFKLVNMPSVAYNTHEKVLICDKKFMVITSFNWLSFAGNQEWGFRQETGYYIEQKNSIEDMRENIRMRMKLKKI